MRTKRQGLVVWFKHRKNIRQLKRLGHLLYVSMKMRYAIIYVDKKDIAEVEKRLTNYSYVIKVEQSYKPFVATTYENPKLDEAKVYDYKMGI